MKNTMLAVILSFIVGGAAFAADNAGAANGQAPDLKSAAPNQSVKAPVPSSDQVRDAAAHLPAEKNKSPLQPAR